MADYKSAYSNISKDYIENTVPSNPIDQGRYDRSKNREVYFKCFMLKASHYISEFLS